MSTPIRRILGLVSGPTAPAVRRQVTRTIDAGGVRLVVPAD